MFRCSPIERTEPIYRLSQFRKMALEKVQRINETGARHLESGTVIRVGGPSIRNPLISSVFNLFLFHSSVRCMLLKNSTLDVQCITTIFFPSPFT